MGFRLWIVVCFVAAQSIFGQDILTVDSGYFAELKSTEHFQERIDGIQGTHPLRYAIGNFGSPFLRTTSQDILDGIFHGRLLKQTAFDAYHWKDPLWYVPKVLYTDVQYRETLGEGQDMRVYHSQGLRKMQFAFLYDRLTSEGALANDLKEITNFHAFFRVAHSSSLYSKAEFRSFKVQSQENGGLIDPLSFGNGAVGNTLVLPVFLNDAQYSLQRREATLNVGKNVTSDSVNSLEKWSAFVGVSMDKEEYLHPNVNQVFDRSFTHGENVFYPGLSDSSSTLQDSLREWHVFSGIRWHKTSENSIFSAQARIFAGEYHVVQDKKHVGWQTSAEWRSSHISASAKLRKHTASLLQSYTTVSYNNNGFSFEYQWMRQSPDLLQSSGTSRMIDHQLSASQATEMHHLEGALESSNFGRFTLSASRLSNLPYFTNAWQWKHSQENIFLLSALWHWEKCWKKWDVSTRVSSQYTPSPELLPTPLVSYFAKFSYHLKWLGNAQITPSIEVEGFSSYHAPVYIPGISQWAVQTQSMQEGIPLVHGSISLTVKRFTVFLRYDNALGNIWGRPVLSSPDRVWKPTVFRLGVRWLFFD